MNVFNGLKAQGLLEVAVLEEKKKVSFSEHFIPLFWNCSYNLVVSDCHLARLDTKSWCLNTPEIRVNILSYSR